jgi:hypothetical protein
LVEQRIENPRVGGSIPPQATTSIKTQPSLTRWALLFLALVKGPRGVGGAKHKDRPERVPRAHRDVVVFGGAHRHRLWVGLVCSR